VGAVGVHRRVREWDDSRTVLYRSPSDRPLCWRLQASQYGGYSCGSHESYTRKFEGCFWMFKTYRSEGVGKNDKTELGAEVRDALAGWPSVMPIKGLVYP